VAFLISLHGTYTALIVPIDGSRGDRTGGSGDSVAEFSETVCTIFSGVILGCTPEPLDEVKFTVKLRIENDTVVLCLYLLLKLPFLVLEISLTLQKTDGTS
jgi:hypothetical protein